MSTLTPELRAEIAQHLREMTSREGMIIRDMERGLTVEQIASSERTSLNNARSYVRGTEAMLRGELPTAPSMTLKASRGYRYLLGGDVSPALRSFARLDSTRPTPTTSYARVGQLLFVGVVSVRAFSASCPLNSSRTGHRVPSTSVRRSRRQGPLPNRRPRSHRISRRRSP